jgi:hypothetical protein
LPFVPAFALLTLVFSAAAHHPRLSAFSFLLRVRFRSAAATTPRLSGSCCSIVSGCSCLHLRCRFILCCLCHYVTFCSLPTGSPLRSLVVASLVPVVDYLPTRCLSSPPVIRAVTHNAAYPAAFSTFVACRSLHLPFVPRIATFVCLIGGWCYVCPRSASLFLPISFTLFTAHLHCTLRSLRFSALPRSVRLVATFSPRRSLYRCHYVSVRSYATPLCGSLVIVPAS